MVGPCGGRIAVCRIYVAAWSAGFSLRIPGLKPRLLQSPSYACSTVTPTAANVPGLQVLRIGKIIARQEGEYNAGCLHRKFGDSLRKIPINTCRAPS